MKTTIRNTILALTLCIAASGCGLIPKRVEFFQDKVKAVPVVTEAARDHQRQAAQYVADKVDEAKNTTIAYGVDPAVVTPLNDADSASHALAESLGPPLSPWSDTSTNLVNKLHRDQAKHNEAVEDYSKSIQKDVGHKIEGTGLFSFSYFTYAGLIVGLIALVWFGLKIYGSINPVVGLGVNSVGGVASSVLSKGFSEVVAGGEAFKTYLANSNLTDDVKNYVSSLFVQAHTSNQSQDVQKIITTLTANPSQVIAPPLSVAPVSSGAAPKPVIPTV